ncbi:hypothetical protein [Actinomarinicola tropica]|uniref:Uncharacterized protein n=1 Tax=Actinomarinicola tropica TaxID=2789776 RepID=A0A5Q2RIE1_9ACTN|nr:hypothetical protein [Actinomarinicola tropica]QGG94341.1 hypothetical protein GH723_04060 [Actinomarinicola tropica]
MSDQGDGGSIPPGDEARREADSDRRWWWAAIAALVAVIVVLLVVLLVQDGDDEDDAGSSTTTSSTTTSSTSSTTSSTTSTSTTTAPPTTTTAPNTTTTSAVTPVTADPAQCAEAGSDPGDPDPAAQAVFIAWTRGDTACADELMTDDALTELFSRDGSGAADVFQGCFEMDEPDPHIDCAFTYPGGSTHYMMNVSPTDGWQVFDVYQVAD